MRAGAQSCASPRGTGGSPPAAAAPILLCLATAWLPPGDQQASDLLVLAAGTALLLAVATVTARLWWRRQLEATGRRRHEEEQRLQLALDDLQTRAVSFDRMAVMGSLASGVAHDINSPLASVVSALAFARESTARLATCFVFAHPADGRLTAESPGSLLRETREALDDAQEACEQLRHMTRDLAIFSRPDEPRRLVDVLRVLDASLGLARGTIRARARLVTDLSPVPPVWATEPCLGQAFLNLLLNAARAIPAGAADRNEISVATRVDPSGKVAVEIRDTGAGIAPEVRARIFDPFQPDPSAPAGALGLPISHGIVTGLGGDILVESEVGKGSLFRVLLPTRAAGLPAGREPAATR